MNRLNLRYETVERDDTGQIILSEVGLKNLIRLNSEHYRFSQVIASIFYYHLTNKNDPSAPTIEPLESDSGNSYIFPICVAYHPDDWTDRSNMLRGEQVPGKKSIFEHLPSRLLKDMRSKKAILLIDQSVEGYHTGWLWRWFHEKCEVYNLDPASIVYMTGDQASADNYNKWCALRRYKGSKLKVIPSISLSHYLHQHYERFDLRIDFDEILNYKKSHYRGIYLYDCLNMRPRTQRILNFLHLFNAGLLEYGNISMPAEHSWYNWISSDHIALAKLFSTHGLPANILKTLPPGSLPRFTEHQSSTPVEHYYDFVERILDDLYKNSWVSLVTESSYAQEEQAVFLSEKTFKPIACMQPFIIVGTRHSLKYLRELGYKTFHPFIDESYDEEADDKLRFFKIMESLKQILSIENKVEWLESMRDRLEHNHRMFIMLNRKKSIEHLALLDYYTEYFSNVA